MQMFSIEWHLYQGHADDSSLELIAHSLACQAEQQHHSSKGQDQHCGTVLVAPHCIRLVSGGYSLSSLEHQVG
jgi:hypothetical protein